MTATNDDHIDPRITAVVDALDDHDVGLGCVAEFTAWHAVARRLAAGGDATAAEAEEAVTRLVYAAYASGVRRGAAARRFLVEIDAPAKG